MTNLGWRCPACSAYHDPPECDHDRTRPCRFCTRAVGALSTGGSAVCSLCEALGVPVPIILGRRAPYDFHVEAGRVPLTDQAIEDELVKAILDSRVAHPGEIVTVTASNNSGVLWQAHWKFECGVFWRVVQASGVYMGWAPFADRAMAAQVLAKDLQTAEKVR